MVILKVGITASGAKAASSHTGSLAGADIAYGAAFKRSGVIRAETFEALFDYARAFAMQPVPAGPRVTVITNAGGPGIMAADAAEMSGLQLPSPDAATADALRAALPDTAAVGNPVDVIGDADPDRYLAAFEILQSSEDTDAIVVIATPQNMTQPTELARRLAAAHDGRKPLLAAFLGGDEVAEARKLLTSLGIPNYPSAERALGALKAMTDYSAWRSRPPRVVTHYPVNRRRVDRLLRWHDRMELQQIGEVEAKEILRAYDFRIPEGKLVETAEQAVEVAEWIGYPVVLKIVSPDIIHKSDTGGVRLNLASADQVRDAFDLLMLRASRQMPDARIRGALIEKMGRRGREVILGMTRDPQFGPMLMFGLGGIFVEVMKDVTFHLAPITAEEAMQMLQGTRSYTLLKGARGQSPVDLDAIAAGLQRISQLSTDYRRDCRIGHQPLHRQRGRGRCLCRGRSHDDRCRKQETMSTFDTNWQDTYADMVTTADQAVAHLMPGQRVFIGTGCAEPLELVRSLTQRSKELPDTEIVHLLTFGEAPYAHEELTKFFRINSFFIAENVREIIQEGLGDYTPIFLSDIPRLFKSGQLPIDAALIQVTPPDHRGMCSLGVSVDIVRSAAENASVVIAQVNPNMPRTLGQSEIHIYDLDWLVPSDEPILETSTARRRTKPARSPNTSRLWSRTAPPSKSESVASRRRSRDSCRTRQTWESTPR